MESLPIFFRMADRRVLLVGDGEPARAKLRLLLKTPAKIKWVLSDPDLADAARADFAGTPSLVISVIGAGRITAGDLEGMSLIYGAYGEAGPDQHLAALARRAGIPVNIVDRPDLCDFTTPAIVDRSPLLVAISTGGAAPVFGRRLRAMIERLLPQGIGHLVGRAGAFRGRLAEILPTQGARRRFWDRLFDSTNPQHLVGLDEPAFTRHLEDLAHEAMSEQGRGHVQLVGAGPGDPELLTLKAQRALQQADVILYDHLVSPAVLDFARRDAEFIAVGKRRGDHGKGQPHIHDLMVRHARAGRHVVRLKSGDPLIFGRAGEEIAALRALDIEVELVPGITALSGSAANAQIPLTHRDHASAITLVTGQVRAGSSLDWHALAGPDRTLAIYMGLNTAPDITAALLADGIAPQLPVAVIENGTRPDERRFYGPLRDLPDLVTRHGIKSPALILIGAVVPLARDWSQSRSASASAAASSSPEFHDPVAAALSVATLALAG
ncbi:MULTISPECIES: siroheme synthase CysG [unclassified Iodidimonas]|uniref:siroheme synthase CysG n=1 Tax=unclassified Iodidimonas TaxID=2626145 RepID=UPI002482728B|nr:MULTISPECIES: siroheme synthase CysG [unclassified Iodidimonas]